MKKVMEVEIETNLRLNFKIVTVVFILVIILSCEIPKANSNLDRAEIPEVILQKRLKIEFEKARKEIVKINELEWRYNKLVDSQYLENIPSINKWEFKFSHISSLELGRNVINFNIYVGEENMLNIKSIRKYLLYTGVVFEKKQLVGIETANGMFIEIEQFRKKEEGIPHQKPTN